MLENKKPPKWLSLFIKVLLPSMVTCDQMNECFIDQLTVVENCKKILKNHGFKEVVPGEDWSIEKNNSYFTITNSSSIIAFSIGGNYKPGNGITIVGTHTDSPCLKVKPCVETLKNKHHMLSIQPYGGGLWHTWMDRPLIAAGRVHIQKDPHTIEEKLIKFDQPIACIPNLAIHLEREYSHKFEINKETQFCAVSACDSDKGEKKPSSSEDGKRIFVNQLAHMANCTPDQLLHVELCLADAQPPCMYGLYGEFLSSPRLDNLFNTYTALMGFVESHTSGPLVEDNSIRMIACFDNEEVGSNSLQGAQSSFLWHLINRVLKKLNVDNSDDVFEKTMANSLLISADQAHAFHPNYPEKYETCHQPMMNKGCVIKYNAQMRYATSGVTASIIKSIAKMEDIPIQEFVVRNDSTCGSTIGPLMSSKLGIPTVDIGFPMLAMHSIRETCGVASVCQAITLFNKLYTHVPQTIKNFVQS